MELTTDNLLAGLYIAVAILIIVVLYHLIFIVVDLRKTVRSVRFLMEEVEEIILKPLSMADQLLEWGTKYMEERTKKSHKHDKKGE